MNTDRCQTCGSLLETASGDGLCPACMLREALESGIHFETDGKGTAGMPALDDEFRNPGSPEEIGGSVSHFEILSKLGSGGMGVVYKARDTALNRTVALKFLPSWMSADAVAKKRFIREARAASALDHPNIATVYEIGETPDQRCFIAMAYYEGRTLTQEIADGPSSVDRAIELAAQLAEGLSQAHEHGVIHRDVKPSNAIITSGGVVKLVDFGLAKLSGSAAITCTGTTGGTPAYMSPEQACGDAVDDRTDIWSLGVVLFELLTGRRPFSGENAAAVVSAVLHASPPEIGSLRPDVPPWLAELVDRCLAKDPTLRPASMSELCADLRAGPTGGGLIRRTRALLRLPRHRRKRMIAISTVGLVVASLGTAWFIKNFTVVGAPRLDSVAVLPFRDLAGRPEEDYFATGMQDALIGELAKISGLRVISRQSTLRFGDTKLPIPEIASRLDVSAVVTASVFREKDTVHLSVHLIEARPEERERWAHAFADNLTNVLTMNRDAARSIAQEIRVHLTDEDEQRLTHTRAISPASYEAYLKGMYHLNKSGAEDHEVAMKYFEEAVEQNPADPYAYIGLAHGYLTLGHGPDEDPDPLGKARAALDRALRLDPTIAEAQTALAEIKLYSDWDLPGFEKTAALALELNPNSSMMHYHMAWYYVLIGDLEHAIAEHYRARNLDPLTPLNSVWIPTVYLCFGRYKEALSSAAEISREYPNHAVVLFAEGAGEAALGHFDRAIEYHEQMVSRNRNWKWALGCTYAQTGRTEDARRIQAEWNELPVTPWNAYGRMALAANLGDLDEAFRWLEHRPAGDGVAWVGRLPVFSPMWDDPRLSEFLERHNLPPLQKELFAAASGSNTAAQHP